MRVRKAWSGGRVGAAAMLAAALCACSGARDPVPSAAYDGRYAGTRESGPPEACGPVAARGPVAATVRRGALRLRLFGPGTALEGTVGDDGVLRASGMWRSGEAFPRMTVLEGRIAAGVLTGTASDLHCVSRLVLHRARHHRAGPVVP